MKLGIYEYCSTVAIKWWCLLNEARTFFEQNNE